MTESAESAAAGDADPARARPLLERIVEAQRVVAAAELDVQSVMDLICDRTQELTAADAAGIMVLDGDHLRYTAATGFMGARVGERLVVDGSLSGWAFKNGQAELCTDIETDPRAHAPSALRRGIHSLVAVPLRHGDEPVGLLQVLSGRRGAFTRRDVHTLELLSTVLSAALSNAAEFEAKRAQVEALTRFRTIFDGASIGIGRFGADGRAVEVNAALIEMLGRSNRELAGMSFQDTVHPEDAARSAELFGEMMRGERDAYRTEQRLCRDDGSVIWSQVTAALERDPDGEPAFAIAMVENITDRKVAEQELRRQAHLNEHQAMHDALTGLANRTLFRERVDQALRRARRDGERVAVLLMDLDRFKEVNDSLGHQVGDHLLQQVAVRVSDVVRASDTVARLGGDEFGLVLLEPADPEAVIPVMERIRTALHQPVVIQGLPLEVEASIGIALFPDDGDDAETLLRNADSAMYSAKQDNTEYAFYDELAHRHDPMRLTLVSELRRAIDESELIVHYQPKVLLGTGEIDSVEVLVRWQHPSRGIVPPDEFIPLAERTGLIRPLTLYVVEKALRQCRSWLDGGLRLRVAVNLSMRHLFDVEFPDQVARVLARHGVEAELMAFEITESAMISDPVRAKTILDRLAAMGIRIAIDDFGTGYSSLAYLKRLPIHEIKIDRSFVMNMCDDAGDYAIVRSVIGLAKNLGLVVVAEGVETETIWNALVELGCTIAQGYLLSKPVEPEALEAWIAARA